MVMAPEDHVVDEGRDRAGAPDERPEDVRARSSVRIPARVPWRRAMGARTTSTMTASGNGASSTRGAGQRALMIPGAPPPRNGHARMRPPTGAAARSDTTARARA